MISSRRQLFPLSSTVDCSREIVKQVTKRSHTLDNVHDVESNLVTPGAENSFRLLCERLHCHKVPERWNLLLRGELENLG